MMNINQILTAEITDYLYPYQIEKIKREVNDYIQLNQDSVRHVFDRCPKCGIPRPKLTGGGYTKAGKPMLKCSSCKHRFVHDHGQLTYYSHQNQDKWDDLIIETQKGSPIKETAAKLDVNESTVFRMRHKYLNSLEELEYPICAEKSDRNR